MRYLLDTHTFIWLDTQPAKLSKKAAQILISENNMLLLSLVSIWEMQIKIQLGKLHLPLPLDQMVREQFEANRILELSIKLPHILALNRLPDIHHAPFDHLLVAQAETEDAVIITNDNRIIQYPIATVW